MRFFLCIYHHIYVFFFLNTYMIINWFEFFFFFVESTSPLRKIKSLFSLLVANANSYCPFFLAYSLTYILKFAFYGWLIMIAPNRVDTVRSMPKGALMALKRIYMVKRSSYLSSVKNFLLYLMWDITNTPMQIQYTRCIPWDCEAK